MLRSPRNGKTRRTVIGSHLPFPTLHVMRRLAVVNGNGTQPCRHVYPMLTRKIALNSPFKANPKYKGKWYAPMIDNPEYKGEWAPRTIPNPGYFEDFEPVKHLNKIVRSLMGYCFEFLCLLYLYV